MNVIRRNILEGYYTEDDIVSKSIEVDCIAKGSKANIGEIREWSGKKYQKQANGQWKEVVEGSKEGENIDEKSIRFEELPPSLVEKMDGGIFGDYIDEVSSFLRNFDEDVKMSLQQSGKLYISVNKDKKDINRVINKVKSTFEKYGIKSHAIVEGYGRALRINPNQIFIAKSVVKKKKVDIETYHDSFTSASTNAREYAESKGYQIDEDDWQTQVALGGKYGRSRPSEGNSHSFTVGLIKDGKPQRKALSFTVYGMSSGKYELVAYVN